MIKKTVEALVSNMRRVDLWWYAPAKNEDGRVSGVNAGDPMLRP